MVLLILLGLALSADQWDKDTTLLQQYADEISDWSAEQLRLADAWQPGKTDAEGMQATVMLHRSDSVLSWSNTYVMPIGTDLKRWSAQSGFSLQHLPSGWHILSVKATGDGARTTLVPLKYELSSIVFTKKTVFPALKGANEHIVISAEKTDYPIIVDGKALAWLTTDGPVQSVLFQWVKFLAWSLFLLVLLALTQLWGAYLLNRYGRWAGQGLVLAICLGLWIFNAQTGFLTRELGALPAFSQQFDGTASIGRSIGDWLFNILLLVWAMIFFHRTPRRPAPVPTAEEALLMLEPESAPLPPAPSDGKKMLLGSLSYLLSMSSVMAATEIIRQLIDHAPLTFDFDHLLSLGATGILVLLGIVGLMIGMFLFSHRLILTVRDLGMPRQQRLTALGIATVVFAIICFVVGGLGLNPLLLLALGVVFAATFDAYVQWDSTGFGWLVCWLLLFSLFGSTVLYRYNLQKDNALRIAYARNLADGRDVEHTEVKLASLSASLQKDTDDLGRLLNPWPFKANADKLGAEIERQLIQENYLFQHYRAEILAYDQEHQALLRDQAGTYATTQQIWSAAKALDVAPGFRYGVDTEGRSCYITRLNIARMGDPNQPAELYIVLRHSFPSVTRVYDQMFRSAPYKNMALLPRFDFAVQQSGRIVAEQGRSNPAVLNTSLENGAATIIENDDLNRSDAVAKSDDGKTVAAVGKNYSGWLKQVYLFSVIFSLASLLLFGLAFANSWLHFLPEEYNLRLSARGSLAKRIHIWNISLLALAFAVVGYLTYRHFTGTARDTASNEMAYRADALLSSLKIQALNNNVSADSLRHTLPQLLRLMSSSISTDANLYAPDGSLIFSSQNNLVQSGLLSGKMNPEALRELGQPNVTKVVKSETAAGFQYFNQYLSVRDRQNNLLGYLAVPYKISDKAAESSDVSDFIGMLASLYVFLLLIAFVVTLLLAQSIIKPVSLLSEKVRQLRLDDKNEPLPYDGDTQDEISELIGQYNIMVGKLEASKLQMVRLEREGAWREMARQVAHDIKNPLTTMKLSMQQLERVSNNPEQAAAYLRKAITRLIEQIDSLAQIASEFSMFANLDIRNKSDVVLNEVVESVHDLFSEQKNVDLNLTLPSEKLHIQGDKNHLIRVFNNLVINAIQAIPSDRRGQIQVSLTRWNESALVKISDNGGGIPPEIRERVFEPNFTTKTSGSGLGLAICKKIIEQHDGDIRFETRDNDGTDFFVEIPVTQVGLQMKFP
ncbi:MAG: HAMP domain-containing histidine kinase [Saprospiraceae bacterium]|nr:HAMP domain-containing histidine kinase [Saprospiraceae bacterium]